MRESLNKSPNSSGLTYSIDPSPGFYPEGEKNSLATSNRESCASISSAPATKNNVKLGVYFFLLTLITICNPHTAYSQSLNSPSSNSPTTSRVTPSVNSNNYDNGKIAAIAINKNDNGGRGSFNGDRFDLSERDILNRIDNPESSDLGGEKSVGVGDLEYKGSLGRSGEISKNENGREAENGGNANGGEIGDEIGDSAYPNSSGGLLSSNGNARQPGLLCPDIYPVDSFPPKAPIIPDIFTVAVETIFMKEQKRQVWNLHIDRAEKIVVHKVDMPNNGKRYEWFYSKIVRDFRSGLEFRISNVKDTADCVVEPISTEFELTSHNLKRFMLEHATLLLNFDPSFVNYWGKRSIRNLQCDIWLHESLGEFVSEFGFANDSTLPISVATFSRESKPDIIAISNIYEDNSHIFNPFAKTQGHPDVSECLDATPLLLRIVLDAPYAKLKMGREFTVLESIRRAVAGLAGISLLRVTDLALTEWPGGTTAFWFSLRQIVNFQELSRNNNTTTHSTIVFPLADAYRILRDVISRHDVTLRVDLSPNEHMLVGIQRGSLISIPRALHPIFMRNINTKSLSVIKASYTSGAVAGLGLAMAVLGLAIGLLLGFVLWNGSTRNNRYWRYPWSNSPIPYGLET